MNHHEKRVALPLLHIKDVDTAASRCVDGASLPGVQLKITR